MKLVLLLGMMLTAVLGMTGKAIDGSGGAWDGGVLFAWLLFASASRVAWMSASEDWNEFIFPSCCLEFFFMKVLILSKFLDLWIWARLGLLKSLWVGSFTILGSPLILVNPLSG